MFRPNRCQESLWAGYGYHKGLASLFTENILCYQDCLKNASEYGQGRDPCRSNLLRASMTKGDLLLFVLLKKLYQNYLFLFLFKNLRWCWRMLSGYITVVFKRPLTPADEIAKELSFSLKAITPLILFGTYCLKTTPPQEFQRCPSHCLIPLSYSSYWEKSQFKFISKFK
jgi:hypothetical protein